MAHRFRFIGDWREESRKIQASAAYKGAAQTGTNRNWVPRLEHPDAELSRNGDKLRARARWLERNTWLGTSIRNALCDNVIGTGIDPRPDARLENGEDFTAFNKAAAVLWEDMVDLLDLTRADSIYGLQRILFERMIFDGCALAQMLDRPDDEDLVVPVQLKLFDVDLLYGDRFWSPAAQREQEVNEIRKGIELDTDERIVAFHVCRQNSVLTTTADVVRVPAADVLYYFNRERPGQTQGCTALAAVVQNVYNLAEYGEAELVANRTNAASAHYIRTPHIRSRLQEIAARRQDLFDSEDMPTEEIAYGLITWLLPDEEIIETGKNRPGATYEPYVRAEQRGIAAGVGASFESITGDYSTTHYSASRAVVLKDARRWQMLQDGFCGKVLRPLWQRIVDRAVLMGKLPVSPSLYFGKRGTRRRLTQVQWQMQGTPWHAPVEEARADEMGLGMGIITREDIARRQGRTWTEVMRQLQREEAEAKRLGLVGLRKPGLSEDLFHEEPDPAAMQDQQAPGKPNGNGKAGGRLSEIER